MSLSAVKKIIKDYKDKPFVWGENDCCLFAANTVLVLTGKDLAEEFRGKYHTKLGAARALKKHGFTSIEQLLTAKLGQSIAPLTATYGDVALIENHQGELAAGIVFRSSVYCVGPQGLIQLPLSNVIHVWRVN
ncbi:DUF6950 family protein [Colwellia psychrerythraea]|uniref:DUF6950 domain-containing protein n=1 Tax=Colwellia psychrerythraea TaxID=28229 RepID=A0A099KD95_COLPS|nr:hypothetical protein [Colwellia psychrerythraea]KGJ88689.1 hypothetical protein ND2E_3877 [Colwellia psychrerythraea]